MSADTTGAGSLSPSPVAVEAWNDPSLQKKGTAQEKSWTRPPLQAGGAKGCVNLGKHKLTHSACVTGGHTPP